jgi:protoporphyrinogen oxidase
MDIGIIGTGISGLSIAQMLKDTHHVTLFESKSDIGGLIKCERVNDCLFHKVGGHVFNAKNKDVLNWFWSFFNKEEEFVSANRKAKILFGGKIIGYPIENYIYTFEKTLIKKIFNELFELQKQPSKLPMEYENFEAFLKANFGETLFELYFKPYNNKIWQTDLKEVSMKWLDGKLPMPNFKEIITSNILMEEENSMVHSSFYYPKNEGSQFIINRLSENLNINSVFNINSIEINRKRISINKLFEFDKIIYTGDIRTLPKQLDEFLKINGIELNALKNLKSNGTSNLFCETDDTDISWLYIPESFTKAHRIIYTGNFSISNNRGSKRKTCVVEFSGKVEYEDMLKEINKLPGNLSPISYNYEKNSYVIQDKTTHQLITKVKDILSEHNIFLLGRFAEWEYYNMDKAIEAAMNLKIKINGE